MSDWAQPFVDAGWAFDDDDETVVSQGPWRVTYDVIIDATGRWHVRLATHDAAGDHRRDYGFKKFKLLAEDEAAYARFVATLIDRAATLTKGARGTFAKELAAQATAKGATMVWFKGEKKVEL